MILAEVWSLLWAQVNAPTDRVVYELAWLRSFDDPRLAIAALAVVVVALVALVVFLYRRDTVELPRVVRALLTTLRCVAIAGLIVFLLGIERRTTKEVVHNSQVTLLVDVSQSMGLSDGGAESRSRLDQVVATLTDTPLVSDLRRQHDVNVIRFDQDAQPIVTLPKIDDSNEKSTPADRNIESDQARARGYSEPILRLVANEGDDNQLPGGTGASAPRPPDWMAELSARGTQTRLGEALNDQFRRYRDAPLAGVIVISDGAQNAGAEPNAAIAVAQESRVPIFTVGVGSSRPRRNLAIHDLSIPVRAYPGDSVTITGYLQATGYEGRFVDVELRRRGIDEPSNAGTVIASERIQIGGDGEITPITFDVEPNEPGRFVYQIRAHSPADDDNPRDDRRESEMDVVDRETRVLVVAGGPSREYRFLRNQLYRDKTMHVDVLLQSASPGISQDANQILDKFPSERNELFQYDCLVAFDPDWTQLDADQVALLDDWVSNEAGGMIVIPGPIHTAQWTRSTEHAKLRDLYPVVFQQRMTLLDDGHYDSEVAWPLVFDRAGREARFLALASGAEESDLIWAGFPGVYGYYAVKEAKPGATVYARIADSGLGLGDGFPIYIAGQFYGAGQVLYVGSGEFWRLRAMDPAYFEVLYTKLIRNVSQGRLLRGSSHGSLLVDRDRYELGEAVVLRARLTDLQHEPLSVESVTAQIVRPDESTEPIALQADAQRAGMYFGQFAVHQEGTYQISLPMPNTGDEPLSKYVQVRVPDLERARPERNDPLLAELAKETNGQYYRQLDDAAYGDGELVPLAEAIPSRAEVQLVKGTPDREFAERQMNWLLVVIAGALFVEWIIRRVNRLA